MICYKRKTGWSIKFGGGLLWVVMEKVTYGVRPEHEKEPVM